MKIKILYVLLTVFLVSCSTVPDASVFIPTLIRSPNMSRNRMTYGTAFAINDQGYVLTSYHVVEYHSDYKIIGIDENFDKKYDAELVTVDKINDLAILKIIEDIDLGILPYSIMNNLSEVGDDVYTLGFPLRATMGDEIKLTNGLISSNSGFSGDITSYQISVPVQPGNSGGPLFNSDGDIVGIINARHTGAENATYAIKIPYLFNLIQISGMDIPLNTENTIKNKKLSDQVKEIKEFVYIIEAR